MSCIVKSILAVALLMVMVTVCQVSAFSWKLKCTGNQVVMLTQNVECHDLPVGATLEQCHWSGWINDVNGNLQFNCPDHKIITAFKGQYGTEPNVHARMKFKCCWPEGTYLSACKIPSLPNLTYAFKRVFHGMGLILHQDISKDYYTYNVCEIVVGTIPTTTERVPEVNLNPNAIVLDRRENRIKYAILHANN